MTDGDRTLPPSSSTRGPEEIRGHIEYLCDLWATNLYNDVEFREGLDEHTAVAIHTHAHHAAKLASALLELDGRVAGIALMPTVRLIFECGITCAWLLTTPDAGRTLLRDGAKMRKTAIEDLVRQGGETGPGKAQAERAFDVLQRELEGTPVATMQARCLSLKDGDHLHTLYRAISNESHAGLGITDLYVIEDERSAIGMSFEPDPVDSSRDSGLAIAAGLLFLAINADTQARKEPVWLPKLEQVARGLGVPLEIVRADGSMA
ncbi:hypothetical protein [Microbacterium paraoxydans]|uniref:hypothetical protein n=1 Tax=Microbacterium paraoxydans TaxID=199592 RepID=UPI003D730D2D